MTTFLVEAPMVFITHIRLSPPSSSRHEHITDVRWRNPDTAKVGDSTVGQMVDWLRKPENVAKVTDGTRTVDVGVVEAKPPFIRTHADGVWSNNLLALPRF